MRRLEILGAAVLAVTLAACGGSSSKSTPATPGFPQPAGTVAVNFSVDDTANKVFTAGQLKWKGSLLFDATTRKITYDSTWSGGVARAGFPTLYDDGPWNVDPPGHEPAGSVAGDRKWGVTVFVTPPATGSQAYEYGLIDELYEATYGNGWIWVGTNGSFNVAAGATAPINATGLTLPAFGTTDLQLTLDTNNLDPATTWDTSVVQVKGSAWAWGNIALADDGTKGDATAGDGIYTFQLSSYVGAGSTRPHTGLLSSGNKPEFIWVLGTGTGVEYKDASSVADLIGVAAATKLAGGAFAPATVTINPANNNTWITVP